MIRIAGHHEIVGVEVVGMLHRLRPPSRARSDYHWARARREVMRWRPRHVGVGWRTAAKFRIGTRGLFFWHFYEDARPASAVDSVETRSSVSAGRSGSLLPIPCGTVAGSGRILGRCVGEARPRRKGTDRTEPGLYERESPRTNLREAGAAEADAGASPN